MSEPVAGAGDIEDLFALFRIEPRFTINSADLADRYRQLAALFHPDRFVNESDSERAQAQANAVRINDAYAVLRSPRLRARHLLELTGRPFDERLALSTPFLAEQMELRERLEGADGHPDSWSVVEELRNVVEAGLAGLIQRLSELLDPVEPPHGLTDEMAREVNQRILEMQFYERLDEEISQFEERLD